VSSILSRLKSRLPVQILLSLLLVFAQQIALADATAYASHGPSHYQCTYDEGASADADSAVHFSSDHFDNGLISSFVIPVFANFQASQIQGLYVGFCSPVSSLYLSRAPPSA
jgi:hypothetical protein